MIDAKLTALAVHPVLGRPGPAVDLGRVARVRVHEHELADVVQQRCDRQAVAVLVAHFAGDAIGCLLGRQRVQSEALGGALPDARALEEVKRANPRCQRLHGLRLEQVNRADHGVDAPAPRLSLVGHAQHGDDEGDVGLDRADHVRGGNVVLGDHRQKAVTRLGEGGKAFEGLEGERQTAPVALVLVTLTGRRGGRGAIELHGALGVRGLGLFR